jgi:hypothetical protein
MSILAVLTTSVPTALFKDFGFPLDKDKKAFYVDSTRLRLERL